MEKCTHALKSEINKPVRADRLKVSQQHLLSDALVITDMKKPVALAVLAVLVYTQELNCNAGF